MVKVALIGCGTMGRTHALAYRNLRETQVVATCDIQVEKASSLAKELGAKVYGDFKDMMSHESFDVLDICLPTYLHKEYAVVAMENKKHVFCEKPIALTIIDGNEMVKVASDNKVLLSVGHVLRFFPNYKEIENDLNSGRLGTPRLIRTTRNQAFPEWSWNNWYQDYKKSGGPIIDLVIHDIDWIIHTIGPVDRVYGKSFGGRVKGQEHCILLLRLKNGAIAHVEGSWAYPKGAEFHVTFEVIGTKGQVEYDNLLSSPVVKQTCKDGTYHMQRLSPVNGIYEPYFAELYEFIQSIINKTPLRVTGQEAVEALRIALAGVESCTLNQPIQV